VKLGIVEIESEEESCVVVGPMFRFVQKVKSGSSEFQVPRQATGSRQTLTLLLHTS